MKIYRPTWVEINLCNIEHNIKQIRSKLSPKTKLLAVVKTNAYGHGLVEVTKTCVKCGVDYLGVTSIDEGITLRNKGVKLPILILGSIYPFDNFAEVIEHKLTPTIASGQGLLTLNEYAKKKNRTVPFHLKVDTGMGRIGISPSGIPEFIQNLKECRRLKLEGVWTHLASADTNPEYTSGQINIFTSIISEIKNAGYKNIISHCANSSAMLKYPESYFDMVRTGLCIYGLLPFPGADNLINTKPALQWKTKVIFIKNLPPGKAISYGTTFVTDRKSVIATLPAGYGDGYSRFLSNKGYVFIKGRKVPVVGRVTMDMIMIDVTDIPDVRIGDEVTLLGSAEDMAGLIGTINYEVVCNIHP
ncbi:MAG: alanine racemase, partial [Elusimicrobia bacterium CG_4_10_14_0_8_um_filter_37_32]